MSWKLMSERSSLSSSWLSSFEGSTDCSYYSLKCGMICPFLEMFLISNSLILDYVSSDNCSLLYTFFWFYASWKSFRFEKSWPRLVWKDFGGGFWPDRYALSFYSIVVSICLSSAGVISYTSAMTTENLSPHVKSMIRLFPKKEMNAGATLASSSPRPRQPLLLLPHAQSTSSLSSMSIWSAPAQTCLISIFSLRVVIEYFAYSADSASQSSISLLRSFCSVTSTPKSEALYLFSFCKRPASTETSMPRPQA